MKKIAVTCEMEYASNPQKFRSLVNMDYVNFVTKAGASPFIVCPTMDVEAIADGMDGLLLTGGKDISPLMYNEDLMGSGASGCNIVRDIFEKRLYYAFLRRGKPIFGICRGFQLIGVLNGLPLVQEINKYKEVVLTHSQGGRDIHGDNPVHTMINRGILRELFGKITTVNSFHHQGFIMKDNTDKRSWIRTDPRVIGWARTNEKAKILEGLMLNLPRYSGNDELEVLVGGVQYHPERLIRSEAIDMTEHLRPFQYVMGMLDDETYELEIEDDEQQIEMEEDALEEEAA